MAKKRSGRPVARAPDFKQVVVDYMFTTDDETADFFRFSVGTEGKAGTFERTTEQIVLQAELFLRRDGVEWLSDTLEKWLKKHKKGK